MLPSAICLLSNFQKLLFNGSLKKNCKPAFVFLLYFNFSLYWDNFSSRKKETNKWNTEITFFELSGNKIIHDDVKNYVKLAPKSSCQWELNAEKFKPKPAVWKSNLKMSRINYNHDEEKLSTVKFPLSPW